MKSNTDIITQVHSLTARSVPLRFREGLRQDKLPSSSNTTTTTIATTGHPHPQVDSSPTTLTSTTTIQLVSQPTYTRHHRQHHPGTTTPTTAGVAAMKNVSTTTIHNNNNNNPQLSSCSISLYPHYTGRDAPSPEHLGIPWAPAAIPSRPLQVPGDTSDDSSAPSASPRRVPRRRSLGRRDQPTYYLPRHHLSGSLTDPPLHLASDSYC